jgi:hypothetical protein
MLFQTVQLFYWLSLSTWFGSVLFIMLAAPIIFRTVRENNPILSHVLSVNLDGQHSTLLAGTIVFNLIARLLQVELICGVALLLTFIAQTFVIDLHSDNGLAAIIRGGLFVLAMGAVLVDWKFVWPKIQRTRSRQPGQGSLRPRTTQQLESADGRHRAVDRHDSVQLQHHPRPDIHGRIHA